MTPAVNQEQALRLMKRKNGASVELLRDKIGLENTKQARGLVDRLRAKGIKIKNVSSHTFKVCSHRRTV